VMTAFLISTVERFCFEGGSQNPDEPSIEASSQGKHESLPANSESPHRTLAYLFQWLSPDAPLHGF